MGSSQRAMLSLPCTIRRSLYFSSSLLPRGTSLLLSQAPPTAASTSARSFRSSTPFLKTQKGGKQDAKKNTEKAMGKVKATEEAGIDPLELKSLENRFKESHTRLKEDLGKLRAGGQFNHEFLEALRVPLDKEKSMTEKLGDLATVVPRTNRQIMVMVGEQDHVKAVSSTILNSKYNLNPTLSPHNPLELQITLPPPTAESRKEVVAAADKAGQKALDAIREARSAHKKKLDAFKQARKAHPDDVHKTISKMEKLVEEANKESKEIVKKARESLQK